MTPSWRSCLALVLAPVIMLFSLNPAWGQRGRTNTPRPPVFRPAPIVQPQPIVPPQPIFNPPPVMPNPMEQVWTCPTCKRELGRGMTPPASVTCCGRTYTNGHSLPAMNFGASPPPAFTPSPNISSAASTASGVVIAMGIGLILFGLLVLGGVGFLVMQSTRSAVPGGKRRRPRRDNP